MYYLSIFSLLLGRVCVVCDLRNSRTHVDAAAAVAHFPASGLLLTRSCEWKLFHVMWLFCVCSSKWRNRCLWVFWVVTGRLNEGKDLLIKTGLILIRLCRNIIHLLHFWCITKCTKQSCLARAFYLCLLN